MALSRTIPIENRIFTVETLSSLLTEVSSFYEVSKAGETRNYYRLSISEDEHYTNLLSLPPIDSDFSKLLVTPVHKLSLHIACYGPDRTLILSLADPGHPRNRAFCQCSLGPVQAPPPLI